VTEVLPEYPDLDQLRRQAKELLRATRDEASSASRELAELTDRDDLSTAQLALARRYGYASWPRLKQEVERKNAIHHGDVEALRRLLGRNPALAVEPVSSCFINDSPLGYLGVSRFHGLTDHERSGELAAVLLAAGGEADGPDGAAEPPLVTAASYGEADMVLALIEAGADLEATGFAVPAGTALAHAVQFGSVDVVDVLAGSGAVIHDLAEAAGVGNLDGYDLTSVSLEWRARATRAAAVCERLPILDQLIESGVPVDADPDTGQLDGSRTLLHEAAYWGKPRSVARLLDLGADPNRLDSEYQSTPLGWCRHRHSEIAVFGKHLTVGHVRVEAILDSVTT
jgi:hypothetical protein